ncbi:hypothetical protein GALMADRAFT_144080 [Galerina marginata CBS 339.88]|uniref:Uncharacterized protein n=1 Tax=Galerina marginata (strain CBS 339.88) TaxID=685588 RepID=A0A067SJ89_GALM3|nr:hypothetical protein GALMADRAFT_144080 [Galerina marginata CBS 339.88]
MATGLAAACTRAAAGSWTSPTLPSTPRLAVNRPPSHPVLHDGSTRRSDADEVTVSRGVQQLSAAAPVLGWMPAVQLVAAAGSRAGRTPRLCGRRFDLSSVLRINPHQRSRRRRISSATHGRPSLPLSTHRDLPGRPFHPHLPPIHMWELSVCGHGAYHLRQFSEPF